MTVGVGYTIFYVGDVEATLRFYTSGFGMQRRFMTPAGDYGELDTGATTLAFASNTLAESNLAVAGGFTRLDTESPPPGASTTLITDDVPSTVAAAVAAGARRYVDPVDKPWGQTVAYDQCHVVADLPLDEVRELIAESYLLVFESLTKAHKDRIASETKHRPLHR